MRYGVTKQVYRIYKCVNGNTDYRLAESFVECSEITVFKMCFNVVYKYSYSVKFREI